MKSIPLLVLAGLGYLALALAMNIVIRVYLLRDLWVTVLGSVNISGLEAAANVAARGEMANALGEGFADGLDVGGFSWSLIAMDSDAPEIPNIAAERMRRPISTACRAGGARLRCAAPTGWKSTKTSRRLRRGPMPTSAAPIALRACCA